jgi:hypothetical protein
VFAAAKAANASRQNRNLFIGSTMFLPRKVVKRSARQFFLQSFYGKIGFKCPQNGVLVKRGETISL